MISAKRWRRLSRLRLQLVNEAVNEILPPADKEASKELQDALCVAAAVGKMPTHGFDIAGARAGYTRLRVSSRAGRVADALFFANLHNDAPWIKNALERLLIHPSNTSCRLVSLGSGPAFDLVGLAMLSDILGGVPIHAHILDFEVGWKTCAESVVRALKAVLGDKHRMLAFGRCDITKSLHAPVNSTVLSAIAPDFETFQGVSTNVCQPQSCRKNLSSKITKQIDQERSKRLFPCIFVASYVVAENAAALREHDFRFFRDLFREAADGSLFVFTETTHRLWPELVHVAFEEFCGVKSDTDNSHGDMLNIALPQKLYHGSGLILEKSEHRTTEVATSIDTDGTEINKIDQLRSERMDTNRQKSQHNFQRTSQQTQQISTENFAASPSRAANLSWDWENPNKRLLWQCFRDDNPTAGHQHKSVEEKKIDATTSRLYKVLCRRHRCLLARYKRDNELHQSKLERLSVASTQKQ